MVDCGEIGGLGKEAGRFLNVTWRIDNFLSLSAEVNAFHTSPYFKFGDARWFLKIYQNGDTRLGKDGWLGIYLVKKDKGPPTSVQCLLGIGKEDNMLYDELKPITGKVSNAVPELGPFQYLRRSELFSRKHELVPSGTLIVICKIYDVETPCAQGGRLVSSETEKEATTSGGARGKGKMDPPHIKKEACGVQTDKEEDSTAYLEKKGETIFRNHFLDLLLKSKDRDVTLKVQDQQFRAHKSILRVRSPMFAAMFDHSESESACRDVSTEDCDPSAFAEFLKYIYVGKVENMTIPIAMGLYCAAKKYTFPDLQAICADFLKTALTRNVVSDVIIFAMKHKDEELSKYAMEFFSKQTMEILMTVEWQRFNQSNPVLANKLIVDAMKISRKKTG